MQYNQAAPTGTVERPWVQKLIQCILQNIAISTDSAISHYPKLREECDTKRQKSHEQWRCSVDLHRSMDTACDRLPPSRHSPISPHSTMSYAPAPVTTAGRQYAQQRDDFNAFHAEASGVRLGEWDVGFCGCFRDLIPNTCMVTCLPFISLAQIASRTGMTKYSYMLIGAMVVYLVEVFTAFLAFYLIVSSSVSIADDIDDIHSDDPDAWDHNVGDSFSSGLNLAVGSLALTASGGCALLWFILVWQVRSRVRGRFQLPGGCLEDCCLAYWCSCCTIAQMATHVKSYTPGSCDFGPTQDTIPAYQA